MPNLPARRLSRRPDRRISLRASILLPLCVGLLLVGCEQPGRKQPPPQPPAVGVIEVAEQKVNPFFEFVGKTRAAESVALRARVTGFLQDRGFEEGGNVERGQVLFKIEPEQYQATLAQAEAALGAAEASLNRAQVDLKRYQELLKSNNVSQQEVDKTQAEVLVQEAAVETAKADIEKARLNVDYTEVVAPIDGRIDVAAFDVGNLIGPDSGVLATINRMDPIKVTFSLAETWYLEILQTAREHQRRVGEPEDAVFVPLLRLPDRSLYQHPGRFDFIDNKVDETTGTVLIRAEFPNPDLILLPGQFVTVVIERKEAVDRVLIPQAAVLTDQGGHYVLLVNDEDRIEARRIETGQRFGPNLVVESGLRAGERIVLYGIQKVRPGLQVKPEPAAAPSDPMDNATEVSVATEEAARPAAADDSPARDMGEGETPDAGGGSGEPIEGSAKDESGGEQPSEDEAE